MLTVKFRKLHADVKLPIKGSSHAACYDVYAHSVRGIIVPRSNLTKYTWVLNNSFGVIDSDYRGEWMAVFSPIGNNFGFPYQVGDRVAQIFFDKVEDVLLLQVDSLDSSDRGTGGFGSTGLN